MKTGDRVIMIACSRCLTVRLVYTGPVVTRIYCSVCQDSVPVLYLTSTHCGEFKVEKIEDEKGN